MRIHPQSSWLLSVEWSPEGWVVETTSGRYLIRGPEFSGLCPDVCGRPVALWPTPGPQAGRMVTHRLEPNGTGTRKRCPGSNRWPGSYLSRGPGLPMIWLGWPCVRRFGKLASAILHKPAAYGANVTKLPDPPADPGSAQMFADELERRSYELDQPHRD